MADRTFDALKKHTLWIALVMLGKTTAPKHGIISVNFQFPISKFQQPRSPLDSVLKFPEVTASFLTFANK